MTKIGILRETKTPVDNRVPFAPEQLERLQGELGARFVVQHSGDRIFTDSEYRDRGIEVRDDISDCDILMGIKEAAIETLIPNKRYVFFGHIAKGQPYNMPLMRAMMAKGITFTDYEYLKGSDGRRVCSFGFWAGMAGAYNTIRLYGLRNGRFELPKLIIGTSSKDFDKNLRGIREELRKCAPRIVITGNGRVAQGARLTLDRMGARGTDKMDFLYQVRKDVRQDRATYCVACHEDLISDKESGLYLPGYLREFPDDAVSNFRDYAKKADILLACHYWDGKSPRHFTKELAFSKGRNNIHVVGDITCDINGSVETTIRPSTHDEPFYDVDSDLNEAPLFGNPDNISVMAIDTLPNALPKEASQDFGTQIIQSGIMDCLSQGKESYMLDNATIIRDGKLTRQYEYLGKFTETTDSTNK